MRKKYQIERMFRERSGAAPAGREKTPVCLPLRRFFSSAAAAVFPVTATIIAQILNFSHFWQIPHKIGTIYKQGGSKRLRPVKNERKCITMPAV
ncbi:MAG TPA: hypothetical protein H9851_03760 [Candidatus Borkfalkia faecavium]|uniref:Uncharacterized protein n=1 Tax=Candidatus Borkfalkia faecavium TaxID=2838508 RepID=A0A9D2AUH1_9FIRM|nr:hypothetical protein [Candidatus Borkfalkia faecavium]